MNLQCNVMESKVVLTVILILLYGSGFVCSQSPECYPGQTYLNSYVNTTTPNGYTLTGYATVCVNGSFIPICNRSSLGFFEATSVCISMGALGGYYGPAPGGVTLQPIDVRNTNRAARNFNCNGFFGNCTWNAPPMAGGICPNGNAILNCVYACNEDTTGLHLFDSSTSVINGINVTTGRPQFCSSGTYSRFCNDGTNSANVGRYLCNSFGFSFGRIFNTTMGQQSPASNQPILYYNNFTCNNNDGCNTPSAVTSEQCYAGQQDLIIRCNNGRPCQGSGPFFYTNVTSVSNGLQLVRGIILNCLNGTTAALCNRNVRQRSVNILCRQLGFVGNGTIIPSNPTLYGNTPSQGVLFYSNLTCPPGTMDINDCEGEPVQCPTQLRNVVIQCSRPVTVSTSTLQSTVFPTPSSSILSTTSVMMAATSTSSNGPTPATSDSNVGVIVGVSVGLVVPLIVGISVIIIILLIVFLVIRRADTKRRQPGVKKDSVTLKSVSA